MNSNPGDSSEVTIREFHAGDYDSLVALWRESQLPYRPMGRDSREKITSEIGHRNSIFLIAEMNGIMVGSIFGTHEGRKGWINRLAVSPSYRRQGIAARLVAEVERRLSEMGIDIVACLVEEWNKLSLEVFERLGYKRHTDILYLSKRKNPDV
jgi:ribosomal protein S18 acetylase RimI-like enzyme